MAFVRGDKVEVCLKEAGFKGSYYAATVVSRLPNDLYVVSYDHLLDDHNDSEPLVETVRDRELRPFPPEPDPAAASEFNLFDSVDAFDNDGWWAGEISAKIASDRYSVFFDSTGDDIVYPLSRLRPHLDWAKGKWVSPPKNNVKAKTKRMVNHGERMQSNMVSSNNGLPANVVRNF